MSRQPWRREWSLHSYLGGLLAITSLLTSLIVGSVFLLNRIPQLEQEIRTRANGDARELAQRIEVNLGALQERLTLLAAALRSAGSPYPTQLIDFAVGDGKSLRALYLISAKGQVVAAGLTPESRHLRDELLGSDMSATPLFMAVRQRQTAIWSDKYLSSLSGAVTLGLALSLENGMVLLAEVPLTYLLDAVSWRVNDIRRSVWVVDQRGEVLADTEKNTQVGHLNLFSSALLGALLSGNPLPAMFSFDGREYYVGGAHSAALGWSFIARVPAGLSHPEIRMTVVIVVVGFLAFLLIGSVLSLFWASRLLRPLSGIVSQAHQVAVGETVVSWPQGKIAEFNRLSSDIGQMAAAILAREQKALAIFNASPVPMLFSEFEKESRVMDVNIAWAHQFRRPAKEVIGRSGIDFNLWKSLEERQDFIEQAITGHASMETYLRCGDGAFLLCHISAQVMYIDGRRFLIWAMQDVTEIRRIERELRDLNALLETRVEERTLALKFSNDSLSSTLQTLIETQHELVRVEKMAALGRLVAGMAHELNTPIGNGMLAISSISDEAEKFRNSLSEGLRRSALERLLETIEQGAKITFSSLRRAAELVTNFKQVAINRKDLQRRSFFLRELVYDSILLLRERDSYDFRVNVDVDIRLDSYPESLADSLSILLQNAIEHGFNEKPGGTVCIEGVLNNGLVKITVSDNGKGIPAELLSRVFDPFFTTQMGRGCGLGLHIAYNSVVNLLGGQLSVTSVVGKGATFLIEIPQVVQ